MIIVKLRKIALSNYLNSPRGEVGRYLTVRAEALIVEAKNQVGVATGELKESIHVRKHSRSVGGQYMEIGTSNVDHALMHHEGTRPHLIVRETPMRFSSRGRVVYTHAVAHPGTDPNRYLSDHLSLFK
jgi:hypothetical protein